MPTTTVEPGVYTKELSDPESVAKGIGPVCLTNLRRMRGAR